MPDFKEYGDFPQLDNGVGMWSLFQHDAAEALANVEVPSTPRKVTCVTGVAAFPLLKATVDKAASIWHNLECEVVKIENNFFGEKITVAGLITGQDIIAQLKGKPLGDYLLIPSNMLRFERDLFLDDVSVEELERQLGVTVKITEPDGYSFICSLAE